MANDVEQVVPFACPDADETDAESPATQPETFYRLLADNTRDVVLVCCPDLTVQWASPSLKAVLGIDPRQIVGTRERLIDPRDVPAADAALDTAIAEHRDHVRGRLRVPHADGRQLWFDVSAAMVWSPTGDLRHAIVSMRDVTAEANAVRSLAASEKRFRTAMADSAIGMALVAPDGTFLHVNRALCQFFGLTEQELVTKTWQELTHPYDLSTDLAALQRVIDGEAEHYRMTKRYIKSDGSVLVGDLSVSAIRDEDGTLSHLVSQIVDMTEQTRVQLELAQSEEHFRLLADNASDVVVRSTNEGMLQWVSKSITDARGWAPEDLVGHAFTEFVHPDDVQTVRLVQRGVRQGQPAKLEVRIRGAAGDYRWFSITVSPIRGANGVMTGRVSSWRDVDSEVEARQLASAREAEFRLLAEHASDVVLRIGADGAIDWVSPSVAGVLGWWPDDMIGRLATEFLDPNDNDRYERVVAELRPGEPARASVRVRCADGSSRWFACIATRVTDSGGADAGRVVGMRDIDEDVRSLETLTASGPGLHSAMESAAAGMAIVDLDRRFVEVNEALVNLVGQDRAWFLGHGLTDVIAPVDQQADTDMRERILTGSASSAVQEKRLVRADGSFVWVLHSIGLLRDEAGQPQGYFSQFLDINQAKQARTDLEFQATHDALTQLPNRRALLARLEDALSQPGPADGLVGVLFCDLDSLKSVNDQFGHLVGDELLVQVGRRLVASLREEDLVARLGGDEFVCVLPQVGDATDLGNIADKLHTAVCRPLAARGQTLTATVSIGATLAHTGDRAEDVIARADSALYSAKRAGGNRVDLSGKSAR